MIFVLSFIVLNFILVLLVVKISKDQRRVEAAAQKPGAVVLDDLAPAFFAPQPRLLVASVGVHPREVRPKHLRRVREAFTFFVSRHSHNRRAASANGENGNKRR